MNNGQESRNRRADLSKSNKAGSNRRFGNNVWPAVLCILVFLFLLPIGLGWHGIFLDDVRILTYPNAVFQANCLQNGIIPLWEPHTFAGAYPFYLRLSSMNFYLPQWLAGLIGTTHPSDQAYRQLVLIPILGHYLWAAVGGFVLGCFGLRLSRPGAVILALFYTLSTSMLVGMTDPPMTAGLAWHPWLIALVLIYSRRRSGVGPGCFVHGPRRAGLAVLYHAGAASGRVVWLRLCHSGVGS